MFRNYLATALRNLVRNKLYAAINIIGLAVGLAAALLIALFVRDELSYDQWIPGHERVYAVHSTVVSPNNSFHNARAPGMTAGLLAQDFSQIKAVTRFAPGGFSGIRHGDLEFREVITWADPNLFEVLALLAVAGNLATALQEPNDVVLTRSMARKYFGSDNPVGQTLEADRKMVMRVTAVLEDLPSNTPLNLGIIASSRNATSMFALIDKLTPPSGPLPVVFTYLRLAPGASADDLKNALPAFERLHPRYQSSDVSYSLELVPLADLHLHSVDQGLAGMKPTGSAATAYSAFSIALLIVAIASINFVNLTTARAARRAVEVGVRKASGAERRNLIVQFIGESMIYAVFGMALAIAFTQLLLPSFNGFLQRTISFDYGRDPRLLGAMFVVAAAVGFFAGAYPALVLSRFSPAGVLKGGLTTGLRGGGFRGGRGRQVLVALQFMILIVLALVSTTIYRQAHYAMNEALRFDKDQVLVIDYRGGNPLESMPCDISFATAVRALPGVRGAACGSRSILNGGADTYVTGPDGATARAGEMIVDFGFFDLFGLQPLAGRAFSRDFGGDVRPQGGNSDGNRAAPPSVVINETLSRALGFAVPQGAVGQAIRWRPSLPLTAASVAAGNAPKTATAESLSQIVGVVPDFARGSLRQAIEPAIFWVNPVGHTMLNVKLQGDQVPETLKVIDQLWKQVGLPRSINRSFLDQQIDDMYRDVTLLSQAMAAFAAVAVFVACLGLFGLATFAAESRTKEIGVRKALGASRADILRLMLWEFNKPVLWASLIAWPIAYFIMRRWLEGFAVRVDMGLELFPVATALVFAIAVLTVAGHALLVARSQPVKALRYE
jgi:putative ABC transport system permease protein